MNETWMARGLCLQVGPDLFFPDEGDSAMPPKLICARCDVRVECLEYALARPERFGVWGGKNERERAGILNQRKRQAAAPIEVAA